MKNIRDLGSLPTEGLDEFKGFTENEVIQNLYIAREESEEVQQGDREEVQECKQESIGPI